MTSMDRVVDVLTDRLGVLRTRSSALRVAGWVVVWFLVLSRAIPIVAPTYADRPVVADDAPAGTVRYVGPVATTDFAGFLPPTHDPQAFTLAWIGGSEIKLNAVSAPAELTKRVTAVGGKPLRVDVYSMPGLRPIDVYRAVRAAVDSRADAIVLALNPVWSRSEWSMRAWPNLDVTDFGSVASTPTWPWLLGLQGPSDATWRLLRAASPLVAAQTRANADLSSWLDWMDVIRDPPGPVAEVAAPADLPADSTEFWVQQFFGRDALSDTTTRLKRLLQGIDVSSDQAETFIDLSLRSLAHSGAPVYVYTTPLAAAALADPEFDALATELEALWARLGAPYQSTRFQLEPRMITRDLPPFPYFDAVHPADAAPIVEALAPKICAHLAAADPAATCTFNPAETP